MRDSSSTAKRLNVTEVVLSRGTRRSIYCLLGKNWPFQQLHVNASAIGMSLNVQTKSGRGYCHPSQANNFIQHGIGLNSTSNTMTVMLQHIIRDIISIYKSNIIMNKNEIKLADHSSRLLLFPSLSSGYCRNALVLQAGGTVPFLGSRLFKTNTSKMKL